MRCVLYAIATACFTGFPAFTSADTFLRKADFEADLTKGMIYFPFLGGFAVFADSLKALAVGAPLVPGLRIFSPLPAAILARLAWILAYSPGLVAILLPFVSYGLLFLHPIG